MGHTQISSTSFTNIKSFNKTHNKSMDEKHILHLPTTNNTNGAKQGTQKQNIIDEMKNLTKHKKQANK